MLASVSLNPNIGFEKTVTDSLANTQLELACRLGSEEDILEALEDGADINFNESTPLFVAVMAGDRAVVTVLVEQGADVSLFGLDAVAGEPQDVIDALMQLAPAPVADEEPGGEDPVEAVRILEGRIYGVHLKDVAEMKEKTESVVLGTGHLDVEGVFRALKKAKLPADAAVSLEFEGEPKNPVPSIQQCLDAASNAARKIAGESK